ncbi:hypothetical protein [Clostridium botulinum]|uniref:hypothetical protein n=1 Tax=Clostridium botulinum TaxID=1491 RepID=UPI001C9B51CF|nr:hypothetical protein [Clostridium botulinum]MBY6838820.1 hypothetical protein [Clostridium botulinum]
MARGKSVKVNYKGIKANYNNGELKGILEVVDEETGEISKSDLNLTTEIKDLLQTLDEEDKITITVKKFKPMSAKEKQSTFKYHCSCDDPREIKSKCDYLNVHCNDCDEDFVLDEEK